MNKSKKSILEWIALNKQYFTSIVTRNLGITASYWLQNMSGYSCYFISVHIVLIDGKTLGIALIYFRCDSTLCKPTRFKSQTPKNSGFIIFKSDWNQIWRWLSKQFTCFEDSSFNGRFQCQSSFVAFEINNQPATKPCTFQTMRSINWSQMCLCNSNIHPNVTRGLLQYIVVLISVIYVVYVYVDYFRGGSIEASVVQW